MGCLKYHVFGLKSRVHFDANGPDQFDPARRDGWVKRSKKESFF